MDFALIISGLSYFVSTVLYAIHFQRATPERSVASLGFLLGGFVAQSVLLGILTLEAGTVPLTTQVLPALCAWLVVIVYVYLELSTSQQALGALIVPIVTLLHLLAIPDLYGAERVMPVEHSGGWFRLHVLAYILAYVAFAISCVSAVMYVMLLGEIQKKHLGYFYERLPSLDSLNQVNNRAATFGFVLLTAGVVSSTIWAYQLDRLWVWGEPTVAPLLLTWVIYAGHLWARYMSGWQGRRAAILSIAGFTVVVLAFPVIGVFFTGVHPLGD